MAVRVVHVVVVVAAAAAAVAVAVFSGPKSLGLLRQKSRCCC